MQIFNKISFREILFAYALITVSMITTAQKLKYYENPKYGPDSLSRVECAKNLSNMSSYVKVNMFDYAYDSWRYCFGNCPGASKNIYIMGAKILKNKIENSEDGEVVNKFIDTLMILYDQRIQFFGQEGYVLGWKGVDLLKYRPSDLENAYNYLKKSVNLMKHRSEEAVGITFMQATNVLYKSELISKDEVVNNYIKVSGYMEERLKSSKSADKTELALDNVEKIFTACGAADCETLVTIFEPKFNANRTNVELLKNISGIFEKSNCTDSELYLNVLVELFNIEPSADLATNIAPLFHNKGDHNKSVFYFKKAIELQPDNETKARLYVCLAQIYSDNLKNYSLARNYAYEAIKLNSNFGDAYILIGDAYIKSSEEQCESDFEKRTVYWAAVDKYKKAMSADPSVSDKAQTLISRYSDHFPLKEETFFHGYVDGQEYTIGGWINEKTVVRTRQN
jgi:tetratricopeptide (TPR) repeat protein